MVRNIDSPGLIIGTAGCGTTVGIGVGLDPTLWLRLSECRVVVTFPVDVTWAKCVEELRAIEDEKL